MVLICQHDAEGAVGLVVNRPAGGMLGDLLLEDLPDALREQPVFVGGPVQPSAFSYLHAEDYLPEANVMPNVSLGHSLEAFVELAEGLLGQRQLRVFAGYSGWSPGQLEDEMARESWLTHPASLDLVFNIPPDELWRHILMQKGIKYRLLADAPDDLSLN